MVYRKGERTNRQREQDFSYAVDIPVPPDGLGGPGLRAIMHAMRRCQGWTEQWSHSEFRAFGTRKAFYVRLGATNEADANILAEALAELGAERAR